METDEHRSAHRGSAQPELSLSFELVAMIGEPIRGSHQGQRPAVPRIKAGHMTAPDSALLIQFFFPLHRRGRPHMTATGCHCEERSDEAISMLEPLSAC
jgi:hypothetical protein